MMKILLWLILSIISSICYRCGGMSKDDAAKPRWIPKWLRNTKTRDLGVSAVCLSLVYFLRPELKFEPFPLKFGLFLLVYGLMFTALTTYWDELFDYDNFYFHGLMIGLSTSPLCWVGVSWYAIGLYAVILTISMGLWSNAIKNDVWEELGRGFLITAVAPILLI